MSEKKSTTTTYRKLEHAGLSHDEIRLIGGFRGVPHRAQQCVLDVLAELVLVQAHIAQQKGGA